MTELLQSAYLALKALHVIAVIAWMAGLFYLPRLFVYHSRAAAGSEMAETFRVMEARLLRIIMTPAMIVAWICGLLLAATPGVVAGGATWFWVKLAAVLALSLFHFHLAGWRKAFAADDNRHTEKFFRQVNEVPTVLMIIIVVMVVVRPF